MLRSSAHLNDNLFHFLLEAQKMKMRQQKFSPSLCTNTLLTDLLIQKGPMTMFHCLVSVFWQVAVFFCEGMTALLLTWVEKKHDNGFPRYNVSLSKHKAHRVVYKEP